MLLSSSRQRSGMLLSTLRFTGQVLTAKIYQVQMSLILSFISPVLEWLQFKIKYPNNSNNKTFITNHYIMMIIFGNGVKRRDMKEI